MNKLKIALTGSLGNIGRPLSEQLVKDGHWVTIISSNPKKSEEISAVGATPAIGLLQDANFLASIFQGSDVVYTMAPPANYFDHNLDLLQYYKDLGNSFVDAVNKAGVKRVINLSSIGAHLKKGNGILEGTYHIEQSLNELPQEVAVTHIRPVEIYYNLFQYIGLIKSHEIMASNLAEDDLNAWVSLEDIANAVLEEIYAFPNERKVRYVVSEEITYKELASTLGLAIGKPDLKWVQITDDQLKENLITHRMQPKIAEKMTEMYSAIHTGLLYGHYSQNKPQKFGKVKLKDFAQEFAMAYQKA
ncbi:MAG: NAD(P)H-binding protein [Bacteroidota bacterium]